MAADALISHVVLCGMSNANEPAGSPGGVAFEMQENGSSPGDSLVLAAAALDEMRAAIHLRLGLVEVARIEGREHCVAVGVGALDLQLCRRSAGYTAMLFVRQLMGFIAYVAAIILLPLVIISAASYFTS